MSANLPAFALTARHAPTQGPLGVQVPFDMTAVTEINGDFLLEFQNGAVDYFQSVKIDNADNEQPFTLHIAGLGTEGDRVVAAPFSIGTYPIFVAPGRVIYRGSSTGGVQVVVTFFNIELPYMVNSVLAGGGGGGGVVTGTQTDFPLTLTGADQIIIPANPDRIRATIQNPPNNINSVWVKVGAVATADFNSQEIAPGQQFDTGNGPLSTAAIHIIGTLAESVFATEIAS